MGASEMIDNQRTMEIFGYVSGDWSEQSHKSVVFVCEQCGKYRVGAKRDHRELCKGCTTGNRNTSMGKGKCELTCSYCGNTFEVNVSGSNRKYCSRICYEKSRAIPPKPNRAKVVKKPVIKHEKIEMPKVACVVCGKMFKKEMSRESNIYCSYACRGVGFSGVGNPMYKGKIKKICEYCGKVFEVYPSKPDIRFCSRKCWGASLQGENNFNWNGGTTFEPYCEKFNNTLKEKIRDDFGRECFICGRQEEENKKLWNERLAVHHVDRNKEQGCNDVEVKMVPLCKSCHGKVHSEPTFSRVVYILEMYDV